MEEERFPEFLTLTGEKNPPSSAQICFSESRFPGRSQIPFPVKIFGFSRIPHRILVKF